MTPIDERFDPDAPGTGDGLYGLPHTPEDAAVVVIPVPFEATASYRRGTHAAPEAIREASLQIDLHDVETGSPWKAGIAMEDVDLRIRAWNAEASRDAAHVHEAGGFDPASPDPDVAECCARVDRLCEKVHEIVRERAEAVFARDAIPAILGGDHSVAFGGIVAAAARFPGLGILHVDAHADLRHAYEGFAWSHASVLHNVLTRVDGVGFVAQVGVRDLGERERRREDARLETWLEPEIAWSMGRGTPWHEIAGRIVAPLPPDVWITFDIDGLDPSLCPHTGTPVPGGLTWREATALLRILAESGRRIVGFDLCEVTPSEDGWDAIVGARLLYKLAGWAITTRENAR